GFLTHRDTDVALCAARGAAAAALPGPDHVTSGVLVGHARVGTPPASAHGDASALRCAGARHDTAGTKPDPSGSGFPVSGAAAGAPSDPPPTTVAGAPAADPRARAAPHRHHTAVPPVEGGTSGHRDLVKSVFHDPAPPSLRRSSGPWTAARPAAVVEPAAPADFAAMQAITRLLPAPCRTGPKGGRAGRASPDSPNSASSASRSSPGRRRPPGKSAPTDLPDPPG